jgi:hypothetical protein
MLPPTFAAEEQQNFRIEVDKEGELLIPPTHPRT